jgi:hypothetical protein
LKPNLTITRTVESSLGVFIRTSLKTIYAENGFYKSVARQVVGGLCASFLLAVLVIFFARDAPEPPAKHVESLDLLQIIWIVKNHPELFQEIGEVDVPSIEKLRTAGMVPTILGAWVDRKEETGHDLEIISLQSRRWSHSSDQ